MPSGAYTELALSEEYSVTLDASGEGWIRSVGPSQYGEEWLIESTQTRVEGSTEESRLFIYRNGTTQLVEGTYSGNLDNSNTAIKLRSGETLWFKYERGSPGARGYISLTGTRRIAGRRGY